jgi:outer membrane protein OmpA-like peptidoglycan-associated protein
MPRRIPRQVCFGLCALVLLSTAVRAQFSVPGITDVDPFPVFGAPLDEKSGDDNYRRLPFRDLTASIHVDVNADLFYDFQSGQVRVSAADLLQQTANLIYERAKSPVRVECQSDRTPAPAAQKIAQACANALVQYLTTQEKVTNVKFISVGSAVPPPAPPDRRDPLAPLPVRKSDVIIDFAKK